MVSKTKGVRELIEGTQHTRELEWETRIRFKQKGYALDPQIATFSVEVHPVHTKARLRGSEGLKEDRKGLVKSFNADISVLHGTPGMEHGRPGLA